MRRPQWVPSRPDFPGLTLSVALGACAVGLARMLPPSPFVSDVLLALVLGALVLNTPLRRAVGIALPGPEREPDRYASGLRFTGKWVLRAAIILMGLKVQTSLFGKTELGLIAGVAIAAVPSAFFVAHALAALAGVRRPMADLLAGGTMICGASAVNAIAPVAGARREEQGLAIGVVFLFSVVALLAFRPLAVWLSLDPSFAGIWSGLAVNDLSSAVAVGSQMGEVGGVMAAASKSARVLLLAPLLVLLSLVRKGHGPEDKQRSAWRTAVDQLPAFVLGYIALAVVRAAGDRLFGAAGAWASVLAADKLVVDLLTSTVAASIGLHLAVPSLLAAGPRAVGVGAGAALWMSSVTLAMVVLASRGAGTTATLVGVAAVLVSYAAFRGLTGAAAQVEQLRRRFESGAPLSLAEAKQLLYAADRERAIDDPLLRRCLVQLHPSIGELIPVRESPLPHGEGCRWITYWEGDSGWALVALCREPGSITPIHAHPHRLIGKAIEGVIEELRFEEPGGGELVLRERRVLGHNELVETDALSTVHVVRVVGSRTAIDLQLRGPEVGKPGRRMRARNGVQLDALRVGDRFAVEEQIDDRPGHGGEGARAGRVEPHVPG